MCSKILYIRINNNLIGKHPLHRFASKYRGSKAASPSISQCDEWMRALGRPDLQGIHADKMHHSKYRVCGAHFHQNSFSSMLMNRLKKEAVPIIFPP
ncbi:hypothetical protein HHI36_024338, partial [Cryptolaemus montrouzieri]